MDDKELEELARRCIRGEATVYEFAEGVADLRGVQPVEALFGPCADKQSARQYLKQALHAATSEEQARRVRSGGS